MIKFVAKIIGRLADWAFAPLNLDNLTIDEEWEWGTYLDPQPTERPSASADRSNGLRWSTMNLEDDEQ